MGLRAVFPVSLREKNKLFSEWVSLTVLVAPRNTVGPMDGMILELG